MPYCNRILACVACALLAACGAAPAIATVLDVAADGSGPYPTVDAAVAAAAAGDTIVLGEGTFTGAGNRDVYLDRSLTIMSANPDSPSVIDCEGSSVTAHRAFTIGNADCNFQDLVFTGGYTLNGAAIYTDSGNQAFDGCVFDGNIATKWGGAIYAEAALSLSITGCVFTGNRGLVQGGALYVASDIEVLCYHSTLYGNVAPEGSGIYSTDNAVVRLNTTIIAFGQGGTAVEDYFGGGWVVGCTDIFGNEGGDWTGAIAGQLGVNNNTSVDPVFCNQSAGNLTLHETSPFAPDNNPCGLVGALPVGCLSTVTVELDGSGDFTSIREALLAAHPGDRILVGPGHFADTGSVIDKPGIRLISPGEDSWIDGQGMAGPVALRIQAADVIVSGLGIIDCGDALQDSTAGLVITGCDPVLNNVSLERCSGPYGLSHGGAMRLEHASPTLNGGRIAGCYGGTGGAVYVGPGCNPAFYEVEFNDNHAAMDGGAFYSVQAGPTFNDCVFRGNTASAGGAGEAYGGDLTFTRCQFLDNQGQEGGALYLHVATVAQVLDCTFAGNFAFNGGGAIIADYQVETAITGTTFVRNGANDYASHISNVNSSNMTIQNCILAFSSGPTQAVQNTGGAVMTLGCSDIFGNRGGDWTPEIAAQLGVNGNIGIDPQLLDAYDEDFRISTQSRCSAAANPGCGRMGSGEEAVGVPHHVVRPDGQDVFPTIQDAINRVLSPAVIELEAGTYAGDGNRDLDFMGKDLELTSRDRDRTTTVIDAEGSAVEEHRIAFLQPYAQAQVTISHLTLRGGYTIPGGSLPYPGKGAGIYVGTPSSLSLVDVAMDRFTGPAVQCDLLVQDLVITGSAFTNCDDTATIASMSNSVLLENCTLDATCTGGLRFTNLDDGLIITGCQIDAVRYPMDLAVNGPVQVTDVGFSISAGLVGASVIDITGSPDVTFTDCRFHNRLIEAVDSGLRLENCDFIMADADAAPINQYRALDLTRCPTDLDNCSFAGFKTPSSGGALRFLDSTISIARSSFADSESDVTGGACFFQASTVDITGTSFSGNIAAEGGALFGDRCNLVIDDCTFTGNSSGVRHHGSSLQGVTITNSTFSGHTAGWAASVDSMLIRPVRIEGCTFSGNPQGLRLEHVPDFRVAHTAFDANVGLGAGQGAFTASFADGAVDTCTFTGNASTAEGGAMNLDQSVVTLTGSTFTGNATDLSGGAIYAFGGELGLDDCLLQENVAAETAGAIYTYNTAATVNRSGLYGNQAASIGGGAYHRYATAHYSGGTVEHNAGSHGGGLAFSFAEATLDSLAVLGNRAEVAAGGLHVYQGSLVQTGGTVSRNMAQQYGGILLSGSVAGQMTGVLVTGNNADLQGSAVSVIGGAEAGLGGCTIVGNGGASSAGQLLAATSSALNVERCIVAFATAGPAAAIADESSSVIVTGSDVFGNAGGDWVGPIEGLGVQSCNFSQNPLFCDEAGRDYQLAAGSPCLPAQNACGLTVGALGEGCSAASAVEQSELPAAFAALGNHPNPFNPVTNIAFEIPAATRVTVAIYDLGGRLVARLVDGETLAAGRHEVTWQGRGLSGESVSSGVYLYRIEAGADRATGKMALLK